MLSKLWQGAFPGCNELNTLLPDGVVSGGGKPVRFVPSTELDNTAYEYQIYTTGRISTRPDSWHDLFNALVWMRFPRIKLAMNVLHYRAWDQQNEGCRGKLRDALTLFDECGVIVLSTSTGILQALAGRCWKDAFLSHGFTTSTQVAICGHAMLEKYLAPYKSMTAKALLIRLSGDLEKYPRDRLLRSVDETVAGKMLAGTLLTEPADLGPLPLAGVPGWWDAEQDAKFYNDLQVFRPPPGDLEPVQILAL